MRTKALLAAAILAAGLASSMAQTNVYSLNVVGYYNTPLAGTGLSVSDSARFKLVCMQLKQAGIDNPTLNNSWTNVPVGTFAYVWGATGWNPPSEFFGPADGWETDYPVPYGTGIMLKNQGNDASFTTVGEVQQGPLSVGYDVGFGPRGPLVPQAGGLTAVHNFAPGGATGDGSKVYVYTPTGWTPPNEYLGSGDGWENGEPSLEVGQAIMINATSSGNWTRNFTVPQN